MSNSLISQNSVEDDGAGFCLSWGGAILAENISIVKNIAVDKGMGVDT